MDDCAGECGIGSSFWGPPMVSFGECDPEFGEDIFSIEVGSVPVFAFTEEPSCFVDHHPPDAVDSFFSGGVDCFLCG